VKILEALAMARPVVSTAVGAEGLGLEHGASVLFAEDPAAFAAAILAVLGDAALARQLGTRGRQHVVEHFDWNRIGAEAHRVLASSVGLACRDQAVAS
jgi:glycosyltransferase involved in cell wall biosynthesis